MIFPDGKDFYYIIGNNGSGKSRALQENAARLSADRNVVVIASGVSDKFKFGSQARRTRNGSYLYLGNRTVGNGTHNGTISANAVLLYVSVLDSGLSEVFGKFLLDVGFDERVGVGYRRTKSSKVDPFDLQDLTKKFVAENGGLLGSKQRPFDAVFYKGGSAYRLSELSSGEQYIITTALKILSSIEDDVCYFIDEPEVSLHVEWQVKWPDRFQKLLRSRRGVTSYVATHSPVIISSALKSGAECYSFAGDAMERIVENDLNVEGIILKEFNTFTSDNKYIFEEIAEIVTKSMGLLDVSQAGGKIMDASIKDINSYVAALRATLDRVSRTDADGSYIENTLDDFDRAMQDLIAMHSRSGN